MLTDVLPLCRGSARARRQCGAWREQGGDPAPGTGGTLGPTGTGTGRDPGDHLSSVGCAAQQDCLHPSPHPLAVRDALCSRSSCPSAAASFSAAPSRSSKPPWMHQVRHGEHHAFLTPSSLSLAPAPLPRPAASWCSWDSEIQIPGVLLRPAPGEVRHVPRGMSAPGALPERSVSPFKSLKHCYYSEAKQR